MTIQNLKKARHLDVVREISLLIRSHYGLIWLRSDDRPRMERLLRYVSETLRLPLFVWRPSEGMRQIDLGEAIYGTKRSAHTRSRPSIVSMESASSWKTAPSAQSSPI
jgi:hypothetical protein